MPLRPLKWPSLLSHVFKDETTINLLFYAFLTRYICRANLKLTRHIVAQFFCILEIWTSPHIILRATTHFLFPVMFYMHCCWYMLYLPYKRAFWVYYTKWEETNTAQGIGCSLSLKGFLLLAINVSLVGKWAKARGPFGRTSKPCLVFEWVLLSNPWLAHNFFYRFCPSSGMVFTYYLRPRAGTHSMMIDTSFLDNLSEKSQYI